MRILGVDPGLRATGYALLQGSSQGVHLLASGVIRTDDGVPLPARLRQIHAALGRVIAEGEPEALAVEDLFAAQRFPRTAIVMGHVRGVVCLAAAEQDVAVDALSPAAAKQAIAGFGGASKAQIQRSVRQVLHLGAPVDPHAADAAALALVALSRRGVPLVAVPREAAR